MNLHSGVLAEDTRPANKSSTVNVGVRRVSYAPGSREASTWVIEGFG